ncbi:MAG: transposase, partial [Candidatus Dormibacteraceae bacterium]
MGTTNTRYPAEVRERAVRLFQEQLHEHPSRWAAMQSIAGKIGCTTQTLSTWVHHAEASADPRKNAALADRERLKQLEREVAE